MSEFLHEEHEKAGPAAWVFRGAMVVAAVLVWLGLTRLGPVEELPPPADTHNVSLLDDLDTRPPPQDLPEPEQMEFEEAVEEMVTEAPEDSAPELTDQLGIVGDGVAGGDAFGLRSRKDGIDAFRAIRSGNGGRGNFAHRMWSDEVGNALRAELQRYPELREINYRVKLEMRFDDAGAVTGCRLLDSTGDSALDELIGRRCSALSIDEPPPEDLPQPLRLAVNVYGAR